MSKLTPSKNSSQGSELDLKKVDAGWLGKIFGCGDNIPKNVGSLIATILSFSIIGMLIFRGDIAKESVLVLIPVLTLILGFLFGQNS